MICYSNRRSCSHRFSCFSICNHLHILFRAWRCCLICQNCYILRWGGGKDDKYFARIGKNVVSVYETETFTLIDKKSIKVENVVDFSWSPTDPILALFVPELGGGNQPARVSFAG